MNRDELKHCIEMHGKDIYSFCRRLTGNVQEAEDLYQDTFLKAVELCGQLNAEENVKSFLLSVCVNLWKNRLRKAARRLRITGPRTDLDGPDAPEVPDAVYDVEAEFLRNEDRKAVRSAVAALPERLRLPVLLFYMEDLKLPEIARILRIPEGTVKSRMFAARKKLKEELGAILED